MQKTLLLLLIFSTLEGCATAPPDTKFDGKWETCEPVPEKKMLCLPDDDIMKLKKILDMCGSSL